MVDAAAPSFSGALRLHWTYSASGLGFSGVLSATRGCLSCFDISAFVIIIFQLNLIF